MNKTQTNILKGLVNKGWYISEVNKPGQLVSCGTLQANGEYYWRSTSRNLKAAIELANAELVAFVMPQPSENIMPSLYAVLPRHVDAFISAGYVLMTHTVIDSLKEVA